MNKISEQLIQLSDTLDKAGKTKCANAVDELIEHKSLMKIAQYVGVIGYVLKQNRAMGNCIRKKRASSDVSMQEIVLGCLSEYQDGQQYDNNEWTSKYAQVVKQVPDQFASSHVDFLEALSEENQINQHIARVKNAQHILKQAKVQDPVIDKMAFELDSLDILGKVMKEGDADHRPFKLAAPASPRSRWSRFWSPSWRPSGKDKDTQFEMDAVIDSLVNIQQDVQQIRGGISQMRYQSRLAPNPSIQQHLQSLSDTNWEQTYNGINKLNQALQQNDPASGLLQVSSRIQENIKQVFEEIKSVQQNMYNLRLRDPVKGSGSLKSASEEYADLSRALDRLYINPLDERALHYSLKLHGRLEDTLNERASAQDPSYNQWVNDPETELGRSRTTFEPGKNEEPGQNISGTMDSSPIEDSFMAIVNDPLLKPIFKDMLDELYKKRKGGEANVGIRKLLELLEEQQFGQGDSLKHDEFPSRGIELPSVVPTEDTRQVVTPHDLATPRKNNNNWIDGKIEQTSQSANTTLTATSIQKLTKVADALNEWNSDLAELIREYIEENEDNLPEFPHVSAIIKEHEAVNKKITQNKAGAIALST